MPKISNKKQKDDLPDDQSGDEDEEEIRCALCHENTDDTVQYGKWISFGKKSMCINCAV